MHISLLIFHLQCRYLEERFDWITGSFILNGLPSGTIIAMSVSGFLAGSKFGWPSIFYFFGAIGIFWSFLFYWLSADYPSDHKKISLAETDYIDSTLNNLNKYESKVALWF